MTTRDRLLDAPFGSSVQFCYVDDNQDLPVLYHDRHQKLRVRSDDDLLFFKHDLNLRRLNEIHGWLGLACRYMAAARPLHRQLLMNRRIIITEQADLHLVWKDTRIFIKPLPAYLLSQSIWRTHLCKDAELFSSARGFLLSYCWLITHKSDFLIASKRDDNVPLLPEGVTWDEWQRLTRELSSTTGGLLERENVNPRFNYGELRLDRLNYIWQFAPSRLFSSRFSLLRGYHYGYYQYSTFFRENFAWLVVVFAYVAIVLSAMQVGLATSRLASNATFVQACSGFTAFSILAPVAIMAIAVLLFLIIASNNLVFAVGTWVRHRREGGQSRTVQITKDGVAFKAAAA